MRAKHSYPEEQIERVLAFLNSRGVGFETGTDQLSDAQAAAPFLAATFGSNVQTTPRVLGELRRLRQALLDLVTSGWRSGAAIEQLNELSKRYTYTINFQEGPQAYLEAVPGTVLGSVLRDVTDLIDAGQWDRVKNCSDEACSSTFFDRSRNKTQRWHAFEVCGNKHNVAVHRARQS